MGPAGGIFIVAASPIWATSSRPTNEPARCRRSAALPASAGSSARSAAAPLIAVHGARRLPRAHRRGGWARPPSPGGRWISPSRAPRVTTPGARPVTPPLRETVRRHARVLLTLGLGILVIGLARASRNVVVPLWADHIGMTASEVSVLFGLGMGIEMLLFYPAGWIMDRFGQGVGRRAGGPWCHSWRCPWRTREEASGGGRGDVDRQRSRLRHRHDARCGCRAPPVVGPPSSGSGASSPDRRQRRLGARRRDRGHRPHSVGAAAVVVGVLSLLGLRWLARWVPRYEPTGSARHTRAPEANVGLP